MRSLKEILKVAIVEEWAVPHFNFSTSDQLRAIVSTCVDLKSPVLVGTSEGERDFFGLRQAVEVVRSYRSSGFEVFLNADHTRSVERAKEAIDEGYDSIHIDLSKENFEKNMSDTKDVVEYAQASGKEISVEGEVGYLPTDSSRVYEEEVKIDPKSLTNVDQAEEFVAKTGVDRFAPAVGNLHGIAANEPEINFDLIKKIRDTISKEVAMVLHGGSGISNEDMQKVVGLGMSNIHVSTELRKAWKESLSDFLKDDNEEYAPYRILSPSFDSISKIVTEKIEIFGSKGKTA